MPQVRTVFRLPYPEALSKAQYLPDLWGGRNPLIVQIWSLLLHLGFEAPWNSEPLKVQIWTCNFEFWLSNSKSEVSKVVHGFFPNCGSPWIFSEWMSPFMDFFRIVGYTEGFRSYRIGLLAFLALCRKMNSPQILNANPTKSPNLEFGQLVGFRPLHKSGKYWA